jgi:hypothetical protein
MDRSKHTGKKLSQPDLFSSTGKEAAPAVVKNFAELLITIDSWTDIPSLTRRKMLSSVRCCMDVIARNLAMEHLPAASFPCDIAWLNDVLHRQPAKAHGITTRTFGFYVSDLRKALRRAGILQDEDKPNPPPEGAWAVLLASLTASTASLAWLASPNGVPRRASCPTPSPTTRWRRSSAT